MDGVSEVRSRLNIEDVISEYVQLKRTGRNFKGLSPWTNERTASFIVSPEKQIWHDFSSGKGGDVFGFVMEMEGLDFRGALEMLARKAGVDLTQYRSAQPSANTKLKARTLEALELAAKFYQKQLTVNPAALKYLLDKRKFSKQTVLTWRLGYSPAKGSALADFLTKKGFTTDEMKRAGLVTMRAGGARDMFRGRIMIPLCDANGVVVGFTARLLNDEPNAPKYINTPQTIVYDKSRQVYGLHLAKEAIRKSAQVVVVEGNLDVIASHQAGVRNVVASAGTAMTEQHLRTLKRFTGDIRLSFDADRAGIAATERMIPIAQKVGVNLSIITIPEGKDPDELIRKNPKLWEEEINHVHYALDWLIGHYAQQLDIKTGEGKRGLTDVIIPTIRRLNDPVEQEHYLKLLAELTDISFESIKAKFNKDQPQPQQMFKKSKVAPGELDVVAVEHQRLQDHLLGMLLAQPKLRWLLKELKADYFTDGPQRQVLDFLVDNPDFKGGAKAAKLREIGDYVKIITLQFEELYSDLPFSDLEEQALGLKHRLIDRYVKIEKEKLAEQMRATNDDKELKKLVQQADQLNALIK